MLVPVPTLTAQLSVSIGSQRDNTLYEDPTGSLSNGAGQYFFTGMTNLSALRRRGLIQFDIASAVPAGAQIVGVDLKLNLSQTATGAIPVALHRVTSSWGEGTSAGFGNEGGGAAATPGDATWIHTDFSSRTWTTPGGDFVATPSSTLSVGLPGPYTWPSTTQLVADAQSMLDNPSGNFGWLLLTAEVQHDAKRFDTKENATPANRPQLVVSYVPKAAVLSSGPGCAGSLATVFTASATGLPVLGNASFAVNAVGGTPNAAAVLLIGLGLQIPPFPLNAGCFLNIDPFGIATSLSAALDATGKLTIPLPVPNAIGLAGGHLEVQFGALDLAYSGLLVSTNALSILPGS